MSRLSLSAPFRARPSALMLAVVLGLFAAACASSTQATVSPSPSALQVVTPSPQMTANPTSTPLASASPPKAGASGTPGPYEGVAVPVPTTTPGSGTWGPYGGTAVPVGVYFIDHGGLRYTFKVPGPEWWTNNYPDFLAIGKLYGYGGPMTRLFLLRGDGGAVFADACHWKGTDFIPGATVDNLVAALAAIKGFASSATSDATVGGHLAKHVRLTVPGDVNVAACDEGEYQGYPGFQDISPGRVQDFWVFEVGGTRHLVWSAFDGNTPAAAQAELTTLVNSLEIASATP